MKIREDALMSRNKTLLYLVFAVILIGVHLLFNLFQVSKVNQSWAQITFWFGAVVACLTIFFTCKKIKDKLKLNSETMPPETDNIHLKKYAETILDWVSFLSLSLMFILFFFTYFILPTNIKGSSMAHTLRNGDRVLMYHFMYQPKRDDIVIVNITDHYFDEDGNQVNKSPDYRNQSEVYFVKRIVAIPGDHIEFVYLNDLDEYHIKINGTLYENRYGETYRIRPAGKDKMLLDLDENNHLKAGLYFAFGDNERFSFDSRAIGAVSEEDLIGKAIFKLSPWGRIQNE